MCLDSCPTTMCLLRFLKHPNLVEDISTPQKAPMVIVTINLGLIMRARAYGKDMVLKLETILHQKAQTYVRPHHSKSLLQNTEIMLSRR